MSDPALRFDMIVPAEMEVGVYSNVMAVWSGPHDFTLDFAVTGQGAQESPDVVSVPTRVVARVKIPHAMAQDVMRALAQHVSDFEAGVGPIPRIGQDRTTYLPEDFT